MFGLFKHTYLNRWWIYQQERFPVAVNGVLIAVFSSSAVSYSILLQDKRQIPPASSLIVAFVSVFCFFLQLRIADEFKDFEDDARYRPYRPVPRGLVSLQELAILGVASAILQLGLALWLKPELALWLSLVWLYLGLMSREFFVRDWLKAHPLIYMATHMVIVPLINLYAMACDWLVAGTKLSHGIIWFLVASFFNGMVIEIGRKIRAPADEEPGVETYSALWNPRNAVLAWLAVMELGAIATWLSAYPIQAGAIVGGTLALLLTMAVVIAIRYLQHPITVSAKLIDAMSGVWTVLVYLSLGIVPLVWRL